jgi:NAD(P)-dependent dehydrogenase (short-subunit alcohol dehydrogenase family)
VSASTGIRFDGRIAIVTGAAGDPGLGRAYAHLLAARGAKVLVNDLGGGPDGSGALRVVAQHVVDEIADAGGESIADDRSVATAAGARAIVKTAIDRWGRVDILINNAGINIPALFSEISDDDIQATIDVHLMGAIWMCRAVWSPMSQCGHGRIVNISSSTALGTRHLAHYGAAKAGVIGLTRALAIEGAEHGITVNSLSPGAGTASAQFIADERDRWMIDTFMKLTPEQVAPAAAFLAHDDCPVTGRHFEAAGGHVDELFFARTAGHDTAGLALESLRDSFDVVLDRTRSGAHHRSAGGGGPEPVPPQALRGARVARATPRDSSGPACYASTG